MPLSIMTNYVRRYRYSAQPQILLWKFLHGIPQNGKKLRAI